jgi:hypothetical protein
LPVDNVDNIVAGPDGPRTLDHIVIVPWLSKKGNDTSGTLCRVKRIKRSALSFSSKYKIEGLPVVSQHQTPQLLTISPNLPFNSISQLFSYFFAPAPQMPSSRSASASPFPDAGPPPDDLELSREFVEERFRVAKMLHDAREEIIRFQYRWPHELQVHDPLLDAVITHLRRFIPQM